MPTAALILEAWYCTSPKYDEWYILDDTFMYNKIPLGVCVISIHMWHLVPVAVPIYALSYLYTYTVQCKSGSPGYTVFISE